MNQSTALERALDQRGHGAKADLADRIGVSAETVRKWCRGHRPNMRHRREIAKVLGVPIRELWP